MSVNEDLRSTLINRGRSGKKERDGRSRYDKRNNSKVASVVKEFNQINMQQLFHDGILTVSIPVEGETNNYLVKIKFGTIIDVLQSKVQEQNNEFNLRAVVTALTTAFDSDDVYVHCSCPDATFRQNYYETVNNINSGDPENRPSNITNPNDDLGPGCKHVMLVLNDLSWLVKVASTINNYVNYMKNNRPKEYQAIIYPAIYGKKYEEESI